jgi:hypothetical protein
LEEFDSIVTSIKNEFVPDQIANIRDNGEIVEMLLSLRNVLDTLGFWVMLILAIVSWFIVFLLLLLPLEACVRCFR